VHDNSTNIYSKGGCIIGVDPGTIVLGFSILQYKGKQLTVKEMSVLSLQKEKDMYNKLGIIHEQLTKLIKVYKPNTMAIEAPFYGKNVQSMLKLGRAQGVAMAAAIGQGLEVVEYSPKKIKQSITGNGNASKEQVFKMLEKVCVLPKHAPKFFDASDALSVAVCHYYALQNILPTTSKKLKGWEGFLASNPERIIKK
jgi:crossover junction endodeoxyribonuclease RuvC